MISSSPISCPFLLSSYVNEFYFFLKYRRKFKSQG